MKVKLLLSAAFIGLIAMSSAIAETVIVPVIPGSLDGGGDGGNGGDACRASSVICGAGDDFRVTGVFGGGGRR